MNPELARRVAEWIEGDPDAQDRATLTELLEQDDEVELRRRFDAPLAFGTAGLRGPEMAGPAGMNRYTVRRATQGVVAWLRELGLDPSRAVVVGRDARRGSERFNDEVVAVLLGAGVRVGLSHRISICVEVAKDVWSVADNDDGRKSVRGLFDLGIRL